MCSLIRVGKCHYFVFCKAEQHVSYAYQPNLCISCCSVLLVHMWEFSFLFRCVSVTKAAIVNPVGNLLAPSGLGLCSRSYYAAWRLWPWGVSCFNTRHRWVTLWACCGDLPSAANSACPESKRVRLTVTKTPISPHPVPLCRCLSDSSLPVSHCHLFTLLLSHCYSSSYSTQGYLAPAHSWLHGKGMRVILCVAARRYTRYWPDRKQMVPQRRKDVSSNKEGV